jgi:NodT family efflux transporter outer membrane factor (OMF) lipoprotein
MSWILSSVLLTSGSGCANLDAWVKNGFKVGPEYARPCAPLAEDWIDVGNPGLSPGPPDHDAWWTNFNDPVLNGLVATAHEQNFTLREAGFRVLEARYRRAIAKGGLFPQQQVLDGSFDRINLSSNMANAGIFLDKFFDQWATSGGVSWELDIWGRFRRAIEESDARLDAEVENYDAVLVLLIADVAEAYVDVRAFERQIQIAEKNREVQRDSLKLAQVRLDGGLTSELDPRQAEIQLAQTEALIPFLETSKRQAENRLCVLLGLPVQRVDELIGRTAVIPAPPPQIAVGIPAELLRRRPDVRRAERLVAAQSARIGVAESELYPHFYLTGTIGLMSEDLSDLFASGSTFGRVGPSFQWNILNYGRIVNNVRAEQAKLEQLAAKYQQAVLAADEEAENAIVEFLNAQRQTTYLQQSANAARRSVELVQVQYREGSADFNRVFTLETVLVQEDNRLIQSQAEIARSAIRLYRALGGGWQIRLWDPPPSADPPPKRHLHPLGGLPARTDAAAAFQRIPPENSPGRGEFQA